MLDQYTLHLNIVSHRNLEIESLSYKKSHVVTIILTYFQVTPGFELYAVFGPLITKPVAISAVNKLLRWIKVSFM